MSSPSSPIGLHYTTLAALQGSAPSECHLVISPSSETLSHVCPSQMGASVSLDSRKGQIVLGNKEGSLVINGGGMVMFGQGL